MTQSKRTYWVSNGNNQRSKCKILKKSGKVYLVAVLDFYPSFYAHKRYIYDEPKKEDLL